MTMTIKDLHNAVSSGALSLGRRESSIIESGKSDWLGIVECEEGVFEVSSHLGSFEVCFGHPTEPNWKIVG